MKSHRPVCTALRATPREWDLKMVWGQAGNVSHRPFWTDFTPSVLPAASKTAHAVKKLEQRRPPRGCDTTNRVRSPLCRSSTQCPRLRRSRSCAGSARWTLKCVRTCCGRSRMTRGSRMGTNSHRYNRDCDGDRRGHSSIGARVASPRVECLGAIVTTRDVALALRAELMDEQGSCVSLRC